MNAENDINPLGRNNDRWFKAGDEFKYLLKHISTYIAIVKQNVPQLPHWCEKSSVSNFDRFMYIHSGMVNMSIGESHITACEGEVVFCPADKQVASTEHGQPEFSHSLILFKSFLKYDISIFTFFPAPYVYKGKTAQAILKILKEMEALRSNDPFINELLLHAKMLELLFVVYGCPAADVNNCPGNTDDNVIAKHFIIQTVIARMLSAALNGEQLDVSELSELVDRERSSFTRYFKDKTGVAPAHFLEQVRMEIAIEKLLSTNLSIKDIALAVGYNDQYHFSRVFSRTMGKSPSEYRKNREILDE